MPLVGYRVRARDGALLGAAGLAYDYVLGAGGVYLVAESACLAATVPVAAGLIRGLGEVHPGLALKPGRLPARLWRLAFDRLAALGGEEGIVEFRWAADGYRAVVPAGERRGAAAVRYAPGEGTVLQLHSHHRMPAYFSRTDDADEQGLALYGVLGRLGVPGQRPEVRLRVGAYGYFAPVPWDLVFAGDRGDVLDLASDAPPGATEEENQGQPEQEELLG